MAPGRKTGGRDWKKGEVPNPKGRPKSDESLTHLMREYLGSRAQGEALTNKEIFIQKTYKLAQEGNIAAVKLIWNYIDGMPEQRMDVTTDGLPFVLRVNRSQDEQSK